jgi:hypothetical protein
MPSTLPSPPARRRAGSGQALEREGVGQALKPVARTDLDDRDAVREVHARRLD